MALMSIQQRILSMASNALSDLQKQELILGIHSNIEEWNESKARDVAKKLDIELTDKHLEVILFLRYCYERHGTIRYSRSLTEALEAKFATVGGLKYLYKLFPGGPVQQACEIAMLEAPTDCRDKAFGTTR